MTISPPAQPGSSTEQAPTRRRGLIVGAVVAVLLVAALAAVLVPQLIGAGDSDGPSSEAIARAFGGDRGASATSAGPGQPNNVDGPAGPGAGPGRGPAGPGPAAGGALLGSVTHGEFTLDADSSGRTVAVQRGEVVSVTPLQIALRSTDGFIGTYRLEPGVQIEKDGQSATVSDVANGDTGLVVAARNGTVLNAQNVDLE